MGGEDSDWWLDVDMGKSYTYTLPLLHNQHLIKSNGRKGQVFCFGSQLHPFQLVRLDNGWYYFSFFVLAKYYLLCGFPLIQSLRTNFFPTSTKE